MTVRKAQRDNALNTITQDMQANKKLELTAQAQAPKTQIPEIPPVVDTVDISPDAREKTDVFHKMLEEMRSEMQALREGLKQAREAGEGAASAWKEKILCLQIAMRIMSGDTVPLEDHRYLRERDAELYSRAIQLRIEKEDPKEYDRLSEDEESSNDITISADGSATAIVLEAQADNAFRAD